MENDDGSTPNLTIVLLRELRSEMTLRFDNLDQRLGRVEERLDGLDGRMERLLGFGSDVYRSIDRRLMTLEEHR
jgi:hypothetical protein